MFDWIRSIFGHSNPQREPELDCVREFVPAKIPPRRPHRTEEEKLMLLRMEIEGPLSTEEYNAEFRRLTDILFHKFAIEETTYDLMLESMNAIENEMNRNGGANWDSSYDEHLDHLREHLATHSQFNAAQVQQINWSLDEIAVCGREIKEQGESWRHIEPAIDYLIARVVDWCKAHPPPPPQEGPVIRY